MTAPHFDMQAAWNRAAEVFRERRSTYVEGVTYGALAPPEDELRLLGSLDGLTVLDIGCGSGQNAVACALAGATVTGLDLSDTQVDLARRLARAAHVHVRFLQGNAAAPQTSLDGAYDRILAVQTLQYIDDVEAALAACRRLLAPDGRLVISLDHPVRDCFLDPDEGDLAAFPVSAYHATETLRWVFGPGLPMQARHWPLARWFAALDDAGLQVIRFLEPEVPAALLDELWPEDSPLAPLRLIPHTAIFVAQPRQS